MRTALAPGPRDVSPGHPGNGNTSPISLPIVEYLRRVDVFSGLSREEIRPLFAGAQPRECPPGTLLFTPDESGERLFVLKVGRVVIYRLAATGKRLVIRRITPVTIFGEMGLLGQSLQGCFAEVAMPSLLCIASREQILEVLRQRPDVALRMLEAVGSHLREMEERLEQAFFSPVQARLAHFLLTNLDPATGLVAGYTHEDIGDTIGASRQSVTETLRLLRDEGLVEVQRKQIRVTDRRRLANAASGVDGLATDIAPFVAQPQPR
ncbi:MAG: Crp/Fnr family transcriptional regulator [Chloroflexi bacterium]|nr:Crp/Fnr family transcriptional regulator [Chloroflexota bacterium]